MLISFYSVMFCIGTDCLNILYGLWVLVHLCYSWCFSLSFKMSVLSLLLILWYGEYCLAVVGDVLISLLFLVMMCPVFITLILYDLSLWLTSSLSAIVSWIHSPPSSHLTVTVDHIRKEIDFPSIIVLDSPLLSCF